MTPLPGRCRSCNAKVVLIDGRWKNPSGIAHRCDTGARPLKVAS